MATGDELVDLLECALPLYDVRLSYVGRGASLDPLSIVRAADSGSLDELDESAPLRSIPDFDKPRLKREDVRCDKHYRGGLTLPVDDVAIPSRKWVAMPVREECECFEAERKGEG